MSSCSCSCFRSQYPWVGMHVSTCVAKTRHQSINFRVQATCRSFTATNRTSQTWLPVDSVHRSTELTVRQSRMMAYLEACANGQQHIGFEAPSKFNMTNSRKLFAPLSAFGAILLDPRAGPIWSVEERSIQIHIDFNSNSLPNVVSVRRAQDEDVAACLELNHCRRHTVCAA